MIKALYFWPVFWIITIAMFSMLVIVRPFFYLAGNRRFDLFCHNIASLWGKTVLHVVPGWKVKVVGRENLAPPQTACVYVANHESMTDIWAVGSLGMQFRWLSKVEVFRVPIIGWAMRWAGYIPITRGDKNSHQRAMDQSAEWIRRGIPMLFFPEGTRSETGELRPFKVGAFRLAIDEKVPIVPIVLNGTGDLMRKGTAIPGRADVTLKILPAMEVRPYEDAQTFADRTRSVIALERDALRGK